EGLGTFALDPPTPTDQHQIARFAKGSKLEEGFRSAIFFFTDDSWEDLQKLVNVRSGGNAGGSGVAIGEAESRIQKNFNDWWESRTKGGSRFPTLQRGCWL